MRLMRDQPQGRVREPVSAIGPAHVRELRKVSATRATCKPPESEARELDALLAVVVRVHSAKGGQDGRSGGLAAPGPWHQELGVRSLCQECDSLVEPALGCGQVIDHVACQGRQRALVEARGVL